MAAAVSSAPRLTFFANDGTPLNGGLVSTYAAGTLTPKTTYSDEAKTVPISNPIVLNAAGRPVASATDPTEVNVYYTGSAKFVVKTSLGATLYTSDNVEEVGVAGSALAFPVTVTGGTSGAIPYFSATTTLSVSALLAAHGVMVGGGAGTAPTTLTPLTTGQRLYGVTGANPAAAIPASAHTNPSDPTATTSTAAYVMMGIGSSATITPVASGRVMLCVTGECLNQSGTNGISLKLAYGTGTAPINGAALTGTIAAGPQNQNTSTSAGSQGFCLLAPVTGLTLTTAIWVDLQVKAITGGTAQVRTLDFSAFEF